MKKVANVIGGLFSVGAMVALGILSTVLLYNPSKFSYWSFVIREGRIDWSALWTFAPESASSWLWLSLGVVMVWAALWLLTKAWRALIGWFDKVAAIALAAIVNILVVVIGGLRDHLVQQPVDAVYLVLIAIIVIETYAMLTRRGELGVFKTRAVEDPDTDLEID